MNWRLLSAYLMILEISWCKSSTSRFFTLKSTCLAGFRSSTDWYGSKAPFPNSHLLHGLFSSTGYLYIWWAMWTTVSASYVMHRRNYTSFVLWTYLLIRDLESINYFTFVLVGIKKKYGQVSHFQQDSILGMTIIYHQLKWIISLSIMSIN